MATPTPSDHAEADAEAATEDVAEVLHRRAVVVLEAMHAFEAELRRTSVRQAAEATGIPAMTLHRWRWMHSANWTSGVLDRIRPNR